LGIQNFEGIAICFNQPRKLLRRSHDGVRRYVVEIDLAAKTPPQNLSSVASYDRSARQIRNTDNPAKSELKAEPSVHVRPDRHRWARSAEHERFRVGAEDEVVPGHDVLPACQGPEDRH